ncbi:MAG: Gfo/Idh/MocA family oxidoreductase [Acidobacteria bacterium]|nr:Gfo/Idh/MocA family oxidoreductase [Acidobacteriota bacterium]
MTSATRIRVAVIGAGLMGRWHAYAAVRSGARVTAVVDSDQSQADRLAARYPGCRAISDLATALELSDVVHVCTPTETHVPLARAALTAGKHAVVEKPLASSATDTAALLSLAASHGVFVCPVHQLVFTDGVRRAHTSMQRIGPVRHVGFVLCSAGAAGAGPGAPGRVALEVLPHPLSIIARLFPDALGHAAWSVRHPAPGEIRVLGQAGDLTVSIVVSMSARPTKNTMEILGVRGAVYVDLFHGFAVRYSGNVSRARKIAQPFLHGAGHIGVAAANLALRIVRREPAYPGLVPLLRAFYAAVASGGAHPIAPSETLAVACASDELMALVSGVRTSLRTEGDDAPGWRG